MKLSIRVISQPPLGGHRTLYAGYAQVQATRFRAGAHINFSTRQEALIPTSSGGGPASARRGRTAGRHFTKDTARERRMAAVRA